MNMIQHYSILQKNLYFILLSSIVSSQEPEDTLALDWDEIMWEEILDVDKEEIQEVDNTTAVSGVRGAESEDEILQYLYYRRKSIRKK